MQTYFLQMALHKATAYLFYFLKSGFSHTEFILGCFDEICATGPVFFVLSNQPYFLLINTRNLISVNTVVVSSGHNSSLALACQRQCQPVSTWQGPLGELTVRLNTQTRQPVGPHLFLFPNFHHVKEAELLTADHVITRLRTMTQLIGNTLLLRGGAELSKGVMTRKVTSHVS